MQFHTYPNDHSLDDHEPTTYYIVGCDYIDEFGDVNTDPTAGVCDDELDAIMFAQHLRDAGCWHINITECDYDPR